jgi:hypothetical protein
VNPSYIYRVALFGGEESKRMTLSEEHKAKLAAGRAAYQERRRREKEEAKRAAEDEYKSGERAKRRVFKRKSLGGEEEAEVLHFHPERSIEVVVQAAIAQLEAAERLLATSKGLLESLRAKNEDQKAASG